MDIREYVESMLDDVLKTREFNKGEELWNILYNILDKLGHKASDKVDEEDNEFFNYVSSYESMYLNSFPSKGDV